jgi:putative FmdB family regulatory protein
MPIYTYYCPACDTDHEKMIAMQNRDDAQCDKCGYRMIRGIDRPGMVWSPTRNGGHSV